MQVNFAMNREMRDAKYPFTRLKGKDVNTLIFPELEFCKLCLQAAAGDGYGLRTDWSYPNGAEQSLSTSPILKAPCEIS